MCQTSLPSTVIGLSRSVTIATPWMPPRAEITFTWSPFPMPCWRASSAGSSMKNPGWSWVSRALCWVQ